MKQDMLVILDLGSTENTAVARAVRALGVYSEIYPHDITASELKELPYESARRWILWLYLLYDFTKSSGYFRWNCNLLTICKRPASSMVMVDRGEIFSKGELATK